MATPTQFITGKFEFSDGAVELGTAEVAKSTGSERGILEISIRLVFLSWVLSWLLEIFFKFLTLNVAKREYRSIFLIFIGKRNKNPPPMGLFVFQRFYFNFFANKARQLCHSYLLQILSRLRVMQQLHLHPIPSYRTSKEAFFQHLNTRYIDIGKIVWRLPHPPRWTDQRFSYDPHIYRWFPTYPDIKQALLRDSNEDRWQKFMYTQDPR